MLMMMIYIGRKCTYNRKKNTEGLVVAGKESGLEVNADKTKYTVMSRDRNAGRSHNIKTDNSSIQINQPTRCNNSSSLLLDVYVQLNMFRASSRPSSGAQQLQ